MIIDFHTHIFPDSLAKKAIPQLESAGNVAAVLDGTDRALLASMDQYTINQSVICSIATRPEQSGPILDFSNSIRSSRLIPFPSFHPAAPDAIDHIHAIKEAGFSGIKLHPYYQDFYMTDQIMRPLYEEISRLNLILLMHTGYDIAFPFERRADPASILTVLEHHPSLKLVTSHFGAWKLWDEVMQLLIGQPIYMDLSFALEFLPSDKAASMIQAHHPDYLLFGSDSPWTDQGASMKLICDLKLDHDLEKNILGRNAQRLLNL